MGVPEIARRYIGGRWQTGVAEDSNGDSLPGAVRVLGPFPVAFSDIPNVDDAIALFTPAAGDVMLAAWSDPRTYDPFLGLDAFQVSVGQASWLTDTNGWASVDSDTMVDAAQTGGSHHSLNADRWAVSPVAGTDVVPDTMLAEPVVCALVYDASAGDPLTAGSIDWYFAVATPAAP